MTLKISSRKTKIDLRQEILDLKVEMEEMYDSFRDQEAEEFRDLQRELEMTAKNCRVLQFKLRKAERRSEQVEIDRSPLTCIISHATNLVFCYRSFSYTAAGNVKKHFKCLGHKV